MDSATVREELGRVLASSDEEIVVKSTAATDESAAAEPVMPVFTLSANRRVRHWVDGLVIGSELFVRNTLRLCRSEVPADKHRLAKTAIPVNPEVPRLCCWRRLRVMLD